MAVALLAALALVFTPMVIGSAVSHATAAEQMVPCAMAGLAMGDDSHQGNGMDTGGSRYDATSCPTMVGAQCLTLVGMLAPTTVVTTRFEPAVLPRPAAIGTPPSRAVSPPHRPPKHV